MLHWDDYFRPRAQPKTLAFQNAIVYHGHEV
jgi:hypothetical protein